MASGEVFPSTVAVSPRLHQPISVDTCNIMRLRQESDVTANVVCCDECCLDGRLERDCAVCYDVRTVLR